MRAVITASCKGEASTKPCPIEAFSVSPISQSAPRASSFQALFGASPRATADSGRSWVTPIPSRCAISDILSMPTRCEMS